MKTSPPPKLLAAISVLTLAFSGTFPAAAEETESISSKTLQQIVDNNTPSPALPQGHRWINAENEIDVQTIYDEQQLKHSVSEQGKIPITPDEPLAQIIKRTDGMQIVTLSSGESRQAFRYGFDGAFLEEKDGYILVRPERFEEPHQIIDPAWAQDTAGNRVRTHYEIDGDILIQHVDASVSGVPVVADPYIRDVHGWGKKIGQELVFNKDETSLAAIGSAYCAGKIQGAGLAVWLGKGACAGTAAIAAHATNTGRCLAIRALGGKYSPNLIFPYATRC